MLLKGSFRYLLPNQKRAETHHLKSHPWPMRQQYHMRGGMSCLGLASHQLSIPCSMRGAGGHGGQKQTFQRPSGHTLGMWVPDLQLQRFEKPEWQKDRIPWVT